MSCGFGVSDSSGCQHRGDMRDDVEVDDVEAVPSHPRGGERASTGRTDWLALFATGSGTVGRRECIWAAAAAFLGLVYLAYPFFFFPQAARSGIAISGLISYVVFAVGCGWAVWLGLARGAHQQRHVMVLLVMLAVLALIRAILYNGTAGFTYISIICALVLPIRLTLPAIATITVVQAGFMIYYSEILTIGVLGFSFQNALLGLAMLGLRRMVDLTRELTAARQELARLAVSEERLRFSRDLHDLLGHSLSLIALKSDLVRRMVGGKQVAPEISDVAQEISDIESVARRALTEVREAVSGYRRQTLAAELDCALETLKIAGMHAALTTDTPPMSPAVEALLGYVVREGVTNVVRHSRASRCEITLRHADDVVALDILDDGIGATDTARSSGSGLVGLHERITGAGGSLHASSASGGGFQLTATVPLAGPPTGPSTQIPVRNAPDPAPARNQS